MVTTKLSQSGRDPANPSNYASQSKLSVSSLMQVKTIQQFKAKSPTTAPKEKLNID
jgi:hypothetical protein